MWRYRRLLPLYLDGRRVSRPDVGWTPLVPAPRLANTLGLRELWVKDEGRNPTGSLKDRASALVVARAHELGERVLCTASSGNAAVSLAACAAAAGVRAVAFVPDTTPSTKLTQLKLYGAAVQLVEGGYEAAVAASYAASAEQGWYCRSTAYNPYTAEGKKTVALEISEQLKWAAPDAVLVPAGDGNIVVGVERGFADAAAMGWISRVPRIIAVQSEAAPALRDAWVAGETEVAARPATSSAESINVALPQDGYRALRAVRASGGAVAAVPDEALPAATSTLARSAGIFAESASVVGVAALPALLASGVVGHHERIVLLSTGRGLHAPALDGPRDRLTRPAAAATPPAAAR